MAKVKIASEGIVHLLVTCMECGSLFEDYTKVSEGRTIAKKHVAETAHEVHVETGHVTIYEAVTQTNKA
jgi:hypothetical protein